MLARCKVGSLTSRNKFKAGVHCAGRAVVDFWFHAALWFVIFVWQQELEDLLLYAFVFFFFLFSLKPSSGDYDWFSIYAGVRRGEKEEESHFPSIHPGVEKDWPLALCSAIKAAAVSWPALLRLARHVCPCDRPIKKMECVNGDGDGRSPPPARSQGASHHLTS